MWEEEARDKIRDYDCVKKEKKEANANIASILKSENYNSADEDNNSLEATAKMPAIQHCDPQSSRDGTAALFIRSLDSDSGTEESGEVEQMSERHKSPIREVRIQKK